MKLGIFASRLLVLWVAVGSAADLKAQDAIIDPAAAAALPDFQLQGEYTSESRGLQIVAQGDGKFLVVGYRGGLPGAGWDRSEREENEETAADVQRLIQDLKLQKVERKSPTLGAKPPVGAVVLFDGSQESLEKHWQSGAKRTDDGLLMQGCMTVDKFTDFAAHIEFLTPFMPKARGQGRGNSGAYYQGRYETQVLDSFGLAGKNNETGGIYEVSDPSLNMCLPPLQWQTYDVEFTAARWNEAGEKTANARLTVRLNGVTVQQDVEVPNITRAAPVPENPEPGPLYFQDHGNPVRYRNLWVVPRDVSKEARRPLIPGFERFHADGSDALAGGRLLVGELGCAACHAGLEQVSTKTAPVLSQVGSRVRPEWLVKYLSDPHALKPGTTMPHVLGQLPEAERETAVRQLTNFLVSTGKFPEQSAESQQAKRGEVLFHEIGCTACHAPRNGTVVARATSIPLEGIEEKYSIPSLAEFLKNPHAVRPGSRMPHLLLKDKEPQELAHYLLKDSKAAPLSANVLFQAYHGDWNEVPNFDELQPVKTGECSAFDVYVAGRENQFGVRYTGFLHLEQAGKYAFHLGSDDGSKLWIDGQEVVDNDGIHPHGVNSGDVELQPGVHEVRIDYFENGGEESVSLEVEGPGLPRQDAGRLLTKTREKEQPETPADPNAFAFDPAQVEAGQKLFVGMGCAACHELKLGNDRLQPQFAEGHAPPALGQVAEPKGCLVNVATAPQYDLSPQQVTVISQFLAGDRPALSPQEQLAHTFTTFNCYACHVRDGRGGPELDRNSLFTTSIPEMGDEGRLPPSLNGVGDKLNEGWLRHILANGNDERDYMRVRMPKFEHEQVRQLADVLIKADQQTGAAQVTFNEADHRTKATGRQLAGDKGLSCIKCHSFGPHKATGIQALPLTGMARRLREDWFRRYLFEPQKYRPGTRMPTGYPDGIPAVKEVYQTAETPKAQADQQIAAIWKYLADGDQAGVPEGLIAQMIELKPTDSPIIYRNFLDGLSPRGIAVGYPEQVNIAWDANSLALKRVWHGRFIDASKHWEGRGPGNQVPLGDHILNLDETVPVAHLESLDTPWPSGDPREHKFRFQGYRLNDKQQPIFRYGGSVGGVEDEILPLPQSGGDTGLRRTLTIRTGYPVPSYARLIRSSSLEEIAPGTYRSAQGFTIKVLNGATPILRESNGQQELLVQFQPKIAGKEGYEAKVDWEVVW